MKATTLPWPDSTLNNIDLAPEFDCPAVKRCCEAWYGAFQAAQDNAARPVTVRLLANQAYRSAMPPLDTPENIADFVACVVHGMIAGAILDEQGTRWLQAARLASILRKKTRSNTSAAPDASASSSSGEPVNEN